MELRHLQAFVAVATDLHFGRAAERLMIAQPTLSELVSRLERELGALLFTRTTRRVSLTAAGIELLSRATSILSDVAAAEHAVRGIAEGATGTVRVGLTPPVAPVLAPYLAGVFATSTPAATLDLRRLWLPHLLTSLVSGDIDVGLTCGLVRDAPAGISLSVICAEPLLVGLRETHRLADADGVSLRDLAGETLGVPRRSLFPAWAMAQQQALADAGIEPPTVELDDDDLAGRRWHEQRDVDWVMLVDAFAVQHSATAVKALQPQQFVPYTMLWRAQPAPSGAAARFVAAAGLSAPPGWQRVPAV